MAIVETVVAGAAKSIGIGSIIGSIRDSIKDIIKQAEQSWNNAFLESMLQLDIQAGNLAIKYQGMLDATLDELDDQERRIINDLVTLVDKIGDQMDNAFANANALIEETRNSVHAIISNNPGFIDIRPAVLIEGAREAVFELRGANMDRIKFVDLRFDGKTSEPNVVHRDHDSLKFSFPLNARDIAQRLADETDGILEIPLSFSLEEEKWLGLFSVPKGRPYACHAYVYRKNIGKVTAFFVGEVKGRETKTFSDSVTHPRVRSSTTGSSRSADYRHNIRPDSGWQFDYNRARFDLATPGGCSNRRCYARFSNLSASGITLDVHAATDRRIRVTCHATSTIKVPMYKPTTILTEYPSEQESLNIGDSVELPLPAAANADNIDGVRLSHVEIESELFENGKLILTPTSRDEVEGSPKDKWGSFELEYNLATQRAFVHSTAFA